MNDRKRRTLFFENVKEPRDGYFVEYCPPGGDTRFARLTLVFHEAATPATARRRMETEAIVWTERYAVPVMVGAVDAKGDAVEIGGSWVHANLIAWRRPSGRLEKHWRLLKDEELPADALSTDYLLQVYDGVPYRTDAEVRVDASGISTRRASELRTGFIIIFAWAIAVPAAVALLGWANPLVGLLITLYALARAAWQGGLMLGWFKPSALEKAKRDKESRMRYYYFHCERNPEGFRRIVAENSERDERERVQREAHELTKASSGAGESV